MTTAGYSRHSTNVPMSEFSIQVEGSEPSYYCSRHGSVGKRPCQICSPPSIEERQARALERIADALEGGAAPLTVRLMFE